MTATGIGIVGSGFMGRTWAEVAAHQLPGARLAAVTGGRRSTALASDYGCRWYPNIDELAADPSVDVAVLATPPAVHLDQAVLLAAAGKHLLIEKPMAQTVEECRQLNEACLAAGVRVAVVSQHRFRTVPQAAREAVDAGLVGRITMVQARGAHVGFWDTSVTGDAWKLDPAQQTAFASWGAHACDLVRWYVGDEVELAYAAAGKFHEEPPPDRSVMATYGFAGGQLAQLWMSYDIPAPGLGHGLDLLLVGTEGMIKLDSYGEARMTTDGDWKILAVQPPFDAADPRDPVRLAGYVAQLTELLSAIQAQRPPLVDGREGMRTTAMLEATEVSIRLGRSIRIDSASGTLVRDDL